MNLKNKIFLGSVPPLLVAGAIALEGDYAKHLVPYQDQGKIWTVCSGHTGKDVKAGERWTLDQCKAALTEDLKVHGSGMLQCVNVPLNQDQYNALTLFSLNIGVGAFCKSNTVLKPLNQGNYEVAAQGMYKWVYIGGKYNKGLYNRRVKEYKIFHGDYSGLKD